MYISINAYTVRLLADLVTSPAEWNCHPHHVYHRKQGLETYVLLPEWGEIPIWHDQLERGTHTHGRKFDQAVPPRYERRMHS